MSDDRSIEELREELALRRALNAEYDQLAAKSKQSGDLGEDHSVRKAVDLMEQAFKAHGKEYGHKSYDQLCEDAAARSRMRTMTMTL
jgi:hypothetical protein